MTGRFCFIDFNWGRIATMIEHLERTGKRYLLYENIPED